MTFVASAHPELIANPMASLDHEIAGWFHSHLSMTCGRILVGVSEAGSGTCIGIVLLLSVLFVLWKRHWYGLLSVLLIVPGGLLINTGIKLLVQRHRPISSATLPAWDGYSFPS